MATESKSRLTHRKHQFMLRRDGSHIYIVGLSAKVEDFGAIIRTNDPIGELIAIIDRWIDTYVEEG